MSRGYEVTVTVYGPGVLHPKQPCLALYDEKANTEIVIADPYDKLLEILDRMKESIVQRQASGDDSVSDDIKEHRKDCKDFQHGLPCSRCEHKACGWCPECHPEVPDL